MELEKENIRAGRRRGGGTVREGASELNLVSEGQHRKSTVRWVQRLLEVH